MTHRLAAALPLLLLAQACKVPPPADTAPPVAEPVAPLGWRSEAVPEDVARIEGVASAFAGALEAARKAGYSRQIEAEGKLLQPDASLPFPAPAPGSYLCRTLRFAPADRRTRAFTTYKPFFCYVGADERLFLTKQTGAERPSGYLWENGGARSLVFLGSIAMGAGDPAIPYGSDRGRDLVGLFERVGPLRFRLIVPRGENRLDVLELLPAPVQNEE